MREPRSSSSTNVLLEPAPVRGPDNSICELKHVLLPIQGYCLSYLCCEKCCIAKASQRAKNVKDYYQKWMDEKAQSLIDKTSRIPPSPFTGSLVRYVFIGGPPHPGMLPVPGPHMNGHGPPMMQMRGPSPHGMMPGDEIVMMPDRSKSSGSALQYMLFGGHCCPKCIVWVFEMATYCLDSKPFWFE
uniref:Uncharacterized protein n=1 Tax=Oncorhynchus kisutch TaxID=8019 RepID=A0A8C7IV75_ONCKI